MREVGLPVGFAEFMEVLRVDIHGKVRMNVEVRTVIFEQQLLWLTHRSLATIQLVLCKQVLLENLRDDRLVTNERPGEYITNARDEKTFYNQIGPWLGQRCIKIERRRLLTKHIVNNRWAQNHSIPT